MNAGDGAAAGAAVGALGGGVGGLRGRRRFGQIGRYHIIYDVYSVIDWGHCTTGEKCFGAV